jgi:hypothetical protein
LSNPRPTTPRPGAVRARPLAGLMALSACLALAACGSNSSGDSASRERASEHANEVKLADFARCLRQHGIEASTAPMPGGKGAAIRVHGGAGSNGPATVEAAQRACARYQPAPQKVNLSPQQKIEQEESVQKFAKCMRQHGIEVHASSSEGHFSIQIHGTPPSTGPNPESPAFQAAQNACQKLLPGGPAGSPRSAGRGPASEKGQSGEGSPSSGG